MLIRRGLRAGVTLIELLVVLVIAGVALSLIAAISLRQQRAFADLADAAAASGQLRDAAALLPIDLRGASSGRGDIREARDTAIELRATIASAVVCDTARGSLVLAPSAVGAETFASFLTPIEVGDTAWVFTPADSAAHWLPYRVMTTANVSAGVCAATGPGLDAVSRRSVRVAIGVGAGTALVVPGTPLRITRPLRYSLYRASDGEWYLGEKDWNNGALRFNTIQPVTGPFLSAIDGGLALRYFDTTGVELTAPVTDTRRIALVRADLRGRRRHDTRILSAAGTGRTVDSLSVVVLLRNRR
jgi:prepilin-type N-terminal cleavage/methylation domain-containing protein